MDLRSQSISWIARLDHEVLATLATESTRLGEALTALTAAALTAQARLATRPALDTDQLIHP